MILNFREPLRPTGADEWTLDGAAGPITIRMERHFDGTPATLYATGCHAVPLGRRERVDPVALAQAIDSIARTAVMKIAPPPP